MSVLKPMLVVLLVLLLLLTLTVLAQRRLVYLPDRTEVAPVTTYFPDGREVTLRTADGLALGGWHVPASSPRRELTVLVAPGNAGNREGRVPLARALSRAGFAVLLFDYRGYGGNPGRPTEAGLALDAEAAYDYLTGTAGVAADRLIYFGESLGAGVVTELATTRPPAGLVLRSPFIDLAEAGAVHYPFLPVRRLLWDRYPVADHVAQLTVPITVVYGEHDSVVPPAQSRTVAERAGGPVTLIEIAGADHNDPALVGGEEVVAAVVTLAEQL